MADMSFLIRTTIFVMVLSVATGQFGFGGYGIGGTQGAYGGRQVGNPAPRGRYAAQPGYGGNPFLAGRGGYGGPGGAPGGFRAGLGAGGQPGFGGLFAAFQPRPPTTTTPAPTPPPLSDEQKKMVDNLVDVIYQNHEKKMREEFLKKEAEDALLTPEERAKIAQDEKIKKIMDAASLYNSSH